MGIWQELLLVAAKVFNRKASDDHYAVIKTVDAVRLNGAQKLDEQLTEANRGENISRILTDIRKFAVDETIKGVTGGIPVHKIAKVRSPSRASDESKKKGLLLMKKKGLLLMMEEMPAKMEKMQGDVNCGKQQNKVATLCDNGLEPLNELSEEPVEILSPPQTGKKRVFIRSRL